MQQRVLLAGRAVRLRRESRTPRVVRSSRETTMPRADGTSPWEIEEHDHARAETSAEAFDRVAFAERALTLLRPPPRTTIAICQGRARVHVLTGPTWGKPGERWAMISVPPTASRRAITLALAELADRTLPWALDVLLAGPADAVD
jgi:hypothetical protein